MKRKHNWILLLVAPLALLSCNDREIFERELYKKVFALVSEGDYNVFEEVFELNGGESIGYVAAVVGGTESLKEDIAITLIESRTQYDLYNRATFDADEHRYAKLLAPEHYQIDDYHIHIPAGERQGKMMIRVRPEGLSPDSTYLISLAVQDYSASEVNEEKRTVLYRVAIENKYASQATETLYRMNGVYDGVVTAGNKIAHPLAWNKIRIMAGAEPFQADKALIDRGAITLEIAHGGRVRIHPYKDIVVKQIDSDPAYPNSYKEEIVDGRTYHVFLLHYEYVLAGTVHTMKEELRLEFKK